jgi:hypothetical protein
MYLTCRPIKSAGFYEIQWQYLFFCGEQIIWLMIETVLLVCEVENILPLQKTFTNGI